MSTKSEKSVVTPYKEAEFEQFLKLIGEGKIENWSMMAEVLDVNLDTITSWKQHPKAKQAIIAAIQKNLDGMERAGKRDWRMYREKLKMLGIIEKQAVDMTTKGDKVMVIPSELLDKYAISPNSKGSSER